jgi:hypothetical protein
VLAGRLFEPSDHGSRLPDARVRALVLVRQQLLQVVLRLQPRESIGQ